MNTDATATTTSPIIFRTAKAACPRCGGWTTFGGMSQHAECTSPKVCAERRSRWLEQNKTLITLFDHVRSFDFADRPEGRSIEGSRACYAEGVVVAIVKRGETFPVPGVGEVAFHDCDHYAIKVTRRVFRGEARAEFEAFVFPPVNGTMTWDDEVTNGVERV